MMDEPLKAKLLSRRRFLVGAGSAAVTLGAMAADVGIGPPCGSSK